MILCSQDPLWSAGKLLHWRSGAWEHLHSVEAADSCTMQMCTVYELASSLRTPFPASTHTGAASREVHHTQLLSLYLTQYLKTPETGFQLLNQLTVWAKALHLTLVTAHILSELKQYAVITFWSPEVSTWLAGPAQRVVTSPLARPAPCWGRGQSKAVGQGEECPLRQSQ